MDTVLEVQKGTIDINLIFKRIDDAIVRDEFKPATAEGEDHGKARG